MKKKKSHKKVKRLIIKLKKLMRKHRKQRDKFLESIPSQVWNKHF